MKNKLHNAISPYLLQHRDNLIAWNEWSESIFQEAQATNKLVFISIGYSSCHWCHVMERESFNDAEVSEVVNELTIPIKVDREEHPEVDAYYMKEASQIIEHVGWPLNVLVEPSGSTLFAFTYLPKNQLIEVIKKISQWWAESKERFKISKGEQVKKLCEEKKASSTKEASTQDVERMLQRVTDRYLIIIRKIRDEMWGGIGQDQKFPLTYQLQLLLSYGDELDKRFAFHTLRKMARGGLFDHIEGGFFRYTIDRAWCVPHFEKMLYDNALLIDVYTEAYCLSKEKEFLEIVKRAISFVIESFQIENSSLFASSFDADSVDSDEGGYYCLSEEELSSVFHSLQNSGIDEAREKQIKHVYGLDIGPLVYDVHGGGKPPRYHVMKPYGFDLSDQELIFEQSVKKYRSTLPSERMSVRNNAVKTSWNALMIHSLIRAGIRCQHQEWVEFGQRALHALINVMYDGRTLLRYSLGEVKRHHGTISDYAALVRSLITLFDETSEYWALEMAILLYEETEKQFRLPGGGVHYSIVDTKSKLFSQVASDVDGQEPSGTSLHIENGLRLFALLGERCRDGLNRAMEFIQNEMKDDIDSLFSRAYSLYAFHSIQPFKINHPFWIICSNAEQLNTMKERVRAIKDDRKGLFILKSDWHKFIELGAPLLPPQQEDFESESPLLLICDSQACLQPIKGTTSIESYFLNKR